jgi:hypothetical protein
VQKTFCGALPVRGFCGDGAGINEGLVDHLEELTVVEHFAIGRASAARGDDPDGGRMLYADALAKLLVSLYLGGELALRIDHEGQLLAMTGGELLRESGKLLARFDRTLIGEDRVAILVAEIFAFGVEPARVHGCLGAPRMEGQGKVVADPRDVVLGLGLDEQGIGLRAHGAFHVIEFDDGHFGAGRWLERGGIVYRSAGRRTAELRARGGHCEQKGGKG